MATTLKICIVEMTNFFQYNIIHYNSLKHRDLQVVRKFFML